MRTVLNSAPDSGLDGVYTFKEEGETGEDVCVDGCIFVRDGEEYCFIEASGGETADVECQVWAISAFYHTFYVLFRQFQLQVKNLLLLEQL